MVGSGAATLVKRVITAAGVDAPLEEALARFLSLYDLRLTHHTRPYQGIARMLDELRVRQISIALLTNKPLQQSVKILEAFELVEVFPMGRRRRWPMAAQAVRPTACDF